MVYESTVGAEAPAASSPSLGLGHETHSPAQLRADKHGKESTTTRLFKKSFKLKVNCFYFFEFYFLILL